MQLNNLVIIPIPALYTATHDQTEFIPLSSLKLFTKSQAISNKDDISWKKSFSAFKKFKSKRDKQAKLNKKTPPPTHPHQSTQRNSHHLQFKQKQFSLINNEMDFSLLHNMEESKITSQYDKLDYYDPNVAPYFQYGVCYKYLQKENKVCRIEGDSGEDARMDGSWGLLKRVESGKQRKQYTRKDTSNINSNKAKSQSYFKITPHQEHLQRIHNADQQPLGKNNLSQSIMDNRLQNTSSIRQESYNTISITQQLSKQKPYCSQGLLPQYKEKYNDPFIIIKASQRRQITSSNESINTSRRGDAIKYRQIKKTNRNNNNLSSKHSSVYSRSIYSQSDRKGSSESSEGSNEEGSHDYGNNELQMIEFDLFNHINPQIQEVKIQHNGLDNLSIFQLKDESEKKKEVGSINNYNEKVDIIKQYDFIVEKKQVKLQQ